MASINLGLAFHNHQPVGNFGWVFDAAYQQAYLPMIEALERHPAVRVSLHYTGPLLDWFREHYPDFTPRIARLVQSGQVEMMTGGYYEPILPSIPDDDKIGQIDMMNRIVREELGYVPTGLWLAERVWEPHLPNFSARCGVEWTVVDDTHFKMVGLSDDDLFGYYVTEEQGAALKVFATSKHLRYTIPWARVDDVIAYLRSQTSDDPTRIAVMGDDGEKFGVWPGTHDLCWRRGWMERFFTAIERNQDWLKIIPLGEYVRRFPARGRVYLPTASYAEMMEWALPPALSHRLTTLTHQLEKEDELGVAPFLRGGFWRYFLVKYDEINSMHKKMLRVHNQVYGKGLPTEVYGTSRADQQALQYLWRGQTNCPYWHGVFGGVYMNDVRTAVYSNLIAAQTRAMKLQRGDEPWLTWQKTDFDCDSNDELLVEGSHVNLYFNLALGGALFEWDVLSHNYNIVNCLTRRPEGYHQALLNSAARDGSSNANADDASAADEETAKSIHEIVRVKEEGLEKLLHYDWYRRACLIDHFLHPGTTMEDFATCSYGEDGDFVNNPYEMTVDENAAGLAVRLWRDGKIWVGDELLPLRVEKCVELTRGSDTVEVSYHLTNKGQLPIDCTYGVEFNFNFLGGGQNPDAYCFTSCAENVEHRFDSTGQETGVGRFQIGNRRVGLGLTIESSVPAGLWRFPVDCVSSSEGGFERVHQGSCFLLHWEVHLESGQSREIVLTGRCQNASPMV